MWSQFSSRRLLMMLCPFALAACILAPSTAYPNSNSINTELLAGLGEEQGDDHEGVQCFEAMERTPVDFSMDSSHLVVRSGSGVQFINLTNGQETTSIAAEQPILTAALSPGGRYLAWTRADHSIQIIQVSDGSVRHSLSGHPDPVLHIRFSPSGDELFSASHDGLVRIWDTETGRLLGTIEVGLEVVGIGVSGDGSLVATVPGDGPIQLWDVHSLDLAVTLGGTGGFDTSDPVFSPDGTILAADLAAGLQLWNIDDGRQIWDQPVNSMAAVFSPDGRWFAYSDIDNGNRIVLIPSSLQGDARELDLMQGPVWELFFSDDSTLLAATDGVELRVWQVSDGRLVLIGKAACP